MEPRPYQLAGVEFLSERERAILGDDMGLGKTVQAILACEAVGADKVLIICPTSLKFNWQKEIYLWTGKPALVFDGNKGEQAIQIFMMDSFNYMVVSFDSLIDRKYKQFNADGSQYVGEDGEPILRVVKGLQHSLRCPWDTIIIDEIHNIRNHKSSSYKAVYSVVNASKSKRVYALTGTPILNRVSDIYTTLSILWSRQYTSYWAFVNKYCNVYEGTWGKVIEQDAKKAANLGDVLSTKMLRRTKAEVLTELPPKQVVQLWVKLEGKQAEQYAQMEQELLLELQNDTLYVNLTIAQINYLKQIAVSTELVDESGIAGAKLEVLKELLEELGDKPVVILTQFKKAAKQLVKLLKSRARLYCGDTPPDERQQIVDDFQAGRFQYFVGTTKAAYQGITLTAADTIIFIDKWWTPAINIQAQDRLHRIGQQNTVTVYELLAVDTIEEDIEQILQRKVDIIKMVLGEVPPVEIDVREVWENLKSRHA